ncbi:MAG: FAD-dependent oxidoreductase [Endozoicomonas sp.]
MPVNRPPTLLLAGGGHSHALLLKRLQQKPLPDCRVQLLSTSRYTPYSGMLPGVIAGHYRPDEAHIDLSRLASVSGCEFIEGNVTELDADNNRLLTDRNHTLDYDFLSINTGSTQSRVIDAPDCISIKPIHPFLQWLNLELPSRLEEKRNFRLVIIGGGAVGVEVSMALRKRLQKHDSAEIHILTASGILAGYPQAVRQMVEDALIRKQISVHSNFKVAGVAKGTLSSTNGQKLKYDQVVLATTASPAKWPAQSTLATDARGFIRVNETLQSSSHANVFACGDIAAFPGSAVARSGVYAVRQAPVLHQNLIHRLQNTDLVAYKPQHRFLSLLSCADGHAIASRGCFRAQGRLIWLGKDWIDRRFMAQFPRPGPGFMELPSSLSG